MVVNHAVNSSLHANEYWIGLFETRKLLKRCYLDLVL